MTEGARQREGEGSAGEPDRVSTSVARRFGDAEITRILQTAAELQERSASVGYDPARGLTLDELRQIALEAGIDPRFVDLAVSDSDAPVDRQSSVIAGGPYSWRLHAEVDGDITDHDRSRILASIRSEMGAKGELDDVFGRMEWSMNDGLGPIIIGISASGGKTQIDVSSVRSGEAGLIHGLGIPFGGVFGAAALAGVIGVSGPAVIPILFATGGASYAAARFGWRLRSAWWERRLRKVMKRISSIVRDVAVLPPAEGEG